MTRAEASRKRCAIYTRKSSEEGLEQEFNSLAAQREACEAFIRSQRNEGWVLVRTRYDDGGFSGGNLERPALPQLITDIRAGRIDIVVVYNVDRLTGAGLKPPSGAGWSMPRGERLTPSHAVKRGPTEPPSPSPAAPTPSRRARHNAGRCAASAGAAAAGRQAALPTPGRAAAALRRCGAPDR